MAGCVRTVEHVETGVSRPAKEPPLPRRNGKLQKAAVWVGQRFFCVSARSGLN